MTFVRSVMSLFAGICLLKVGPERMPTFGPFVVTVVVLTLVIEMSALLMSWPHVTVGVALGATLVEITAITACIWGLLKAHGTPGRFAATITAVLGCNVLMTLVHFALLPLVSVLPTALGQALASVLLVWNLAIFAFILHRSLDVGMFSALLIAFGILMMAFTMMVLTNPMLLPTCRNNLTATPMHIHFLGIGGTLMGSLALLARERGDTVSGCDQDLYPPMSDQLASAGIDARLGWDPAHLDDNPDLVVVGNANLPRGNPVVEAVLARGLPYTSGAEWLGRDVLADRWVLAVSGTHGKTTTTAMLAHILEYAGLSPGYLIGGVPLDFEHSARLGATPFFVVEADEYDTSYFDRRAKFVHYRPRTLIINNLEWDHADIYPDLAAIQAQFALLLRSVPGNALIVAPHGSAAVDEVFERGVWTPVERFVPPGGAATDGAWQAREVAGDGSRFSVALRDAAFGTVQVFGTVQWSQLGRHNITNALAAIAAARHAGVPAAIGVEALTTFRGVKRRMEVIAASDAVTVYDDFAHHPTAIRTTLAGLRARVGSDEIVAVIEPRSHTMSMGALRRDLINCASAADRVIWRRTDRLQWDISEFRDAAVHTEIAEDNSTIVERLRALPAPRGRRHVVIMSNGSFGGIHGEIKAALCPPPDAH